jgi:hypothetical protein
MNVYFTVDTESSMGGAWQHPDRRPLNASRRIFCRIGGASFGVPLLVRIMGNFGLRGTYFVETLASRCLGEPDLRSVFEFLLHEGQDVQLHIHPNYRFYSDWKDAQRNGTQYAIPEPRDLIGHFSESLQLELLSEAIGYFEKCAGCRPTAFRAGNFAGSHSMMRCLHKLGIYVDSSFNPCFHPEVSFPESMPSPNVVRNIQGVWELPVTVARTRLPEGYKGLKFADSSALSSPEIRTMLDSAEASGQRHFVIVFHSFSAVKARDATYEEMRPNRIVIRRLEKLFEYLAANGERFQVQTMGHAAANLDLLEEGSEQELPDLGIIKPSVRKVVQLINRAYWV